LEGNGLFLFKKKETNPEPTRGSEKNHENISQNSWSPVWNSNSRALGAKQVLSPNFEVR